LLSPEYFRYRAALEVETPLGYPRTLTLVITADKQRFPCRVVRRKEKRLCVAFE
jgi:hypothetical protein